MDLKGIKMRALFHGLFLAWLLALTPPALAQGLHFTMDSKFLTPPSGMATVGDSHGDIAVSPSGDIYISVQGGDHAGVQIYSADGHYLRNLPGAPTDLHGFIIARGHDGQPYIFGVSRLAQQIVQIALDGRRVLTIPATSVPDQYQNHEAGKPATNLTGIAVAPNGDIYVTDGYGLDFIHRFDSRGHYIASFGGKGPPWNFNTCHKIAIDTRFAPVRLICTDRRNNRLVHMDLEGHVLGTFAQNLRLPSALATHGDELAVAELAGRVTVLGKNGEVLATIGQNDNADQISTNKAPPQIWQEGVFYAPHGITYDARGNLLVCEFNQWGRITRLTRLAPP
jgi:hypothetical protein